MNIEKLVAAAKEIDRLSRLQEIRSSRYQELATMARAASDPNELRQIQAESRGHGCQVVDFGNAINDLRKALRAKPSRILSAQTASR